MMRLPELGDSSKTMVLGDFSGGVNYSSEPHKIKDDQLSELCNMEYRNGVLSKRSGYTTVFENEAYGEVLAVKEWNEFLYFACRHVIGRVHLRNHQIEILAEGLEFEKNGTFLIKEGVVFYFSGQGIYRFGGKVGSFGVATQEVTETLIACKLEENVYTDGNTVYDFSGETATSYSIYTDETFAFTHICVDENTVYGCVKDSAIIPEVRIVGLKLKKTDGRYSVEEKTVDVTKTFPFAVSATSVLECEGHFIRKMFAIKGTLYFQSLILVRAASGQTRYVGYAPAVIRYVVETNAIESESSNFTVTTNSDNHKYELCDRWKHKAFRLQSYIPASGTKKTFIYVTDYETGETTSFKCDYMCVQEASSSNVPKAHIACMFAVAENMVLVTYMNTETHLYQSDLLLLKDNVSYKVDQAGYAIGWLHPIGDTWFGLSPASNGGKNYYLELGIEENRRMVKSYHFSEFEGILLGEERITASEVQYRGYDFAAYQGQIMRMVSSKTNAVPVEGYVPTVLAAQYIESTEQYETVSAESYNLLNRLAKVSFTDSVSDEVTEITLPFYYQQVEDIVSTANAYITYQKSGDSILVTSDRPFILGEELIVILKDDGVERAPGKCHLAIAYGGSTTTVDSGGRLYLAGNPDKPEAYYVSELNQFDYFPDFNENITEDSGQEITGFSKHYQDLIIFKNRSISVIPYAQTDNSFLPVRRIHDTIGCDMPGSIQTVNNHIVFGNSEKGLFLLSLQQMSSERNLRPISLHINNGLDSFSEPEKRKAKSMDFKNRYYLSVGNKIYIWDYELSPYNGYQENMAWFEYRNIPAGFLFSMDEKLAFCEKNSFVVNLFDGSTDDNGAEIESFFQTKAFDFGDGSTLKGIYQLWMVLTCNRAMTLTIDCADETGRTQRYPVCVRGKLLANTVTQRLKLKRIRYLSFRIGNVQNHTDYGVSEIKLKYEIYKSRR